MHTNFPPQNHPSTDPAFAAQQKAKVDFLAHAAEQRMSPAELDDQLHASGWSDLERKAVIDAYIPPQQRHGALWAITYAATAAAALCGAAAVHMWFDGIDQYSYEYVTFASAVAATIVAAPTAIVSRYLAYRAVTDRRQPLARWSATRRKWATALAVGAGAIGAIRLVSYLTSLIVSLADEPVAGMERSDGGSAFAQVLVSLLFAGGTLAYALRERTQPAS